MASQVEICNAALRKLGAQRITSMTDGTRNAQLLSDLWQMVLDAELAAEPWTFAMKRTQLPASSTAPLFGWNHAYPLPSDYLQLVEIDEDWLFYISDTTPLFTIEANASGNLSILTDQTSPLNVRYIYRVSNPGLFPALFAESLACRLAAEACETITQNLSKRQAAWEGRKEAIRQAKRANAIALPPRNPPDGSWVRAMTEA